MRQKLWACFAALSIAALCPGAEDHLVLDESAYLRSYYQFGADRVSPTLMKIEAEKLNPKRAERLKNAALRALKNAGVDASSIDWRENVRVANVVDLEWLSGTAVDNEPPPPDWQKPEFDDASWPRRRMPHLVGARPPDWDQPRKMSMRLAAFRIWFEVSDPAAVLKLQLLYRGGARVFLNGTEIARGGLPQGELDAQAAAQEYPPDAYTTLPGEIPADFDKNAKDKVVFWPEIYCRPFEEAARNIKGDDPRVPTMAGFPTINRASWERVQKARERSLGSLNLPAKLLRKGGNLLAIELRPSLLHPVIFSEAHKPWSAACWPHALLTKLSLRSASASVPEGLRRPPGVQVWAEDAHARLGPADFLEPGAPRGTLRLQAARNGSFYGQVAVGTEKSLSALKVTLADLKLDGGTAVLPASGVRVSFVAPYPLSEIGRLGGGMMLNRLGSELSGSLAPFQRFDPVSGQPQAEPKGPAFYDHLCARPPATVAGGTCQPVGLTFQIPENAAPGKYRGTLRVEAGGMEPAELPVEVDVAGWRVPAPSEFKMFAAVEQSPWGVAKLYKVPLWSERHFQLMEASFKQLARIGNDWLTVPVLSSTEFGNRNDSMIKWTRRKDGTLSFDFALLDRYIELATKHCGKPAVLNFIVVHGGPDNPLVVQVADEASGKSEALELASPQKPAKQSATQWEAFARALAAHMKEKGIEKSAYWGHEWDPDEKYGLKELLLQYAPEIFWTRGSHYSKIDKFHRAVSVIYGFEPHPAGQGMGWKNGQIMLLNPRSVDNKLHACEGTSVPFAYRVLPERVFTGGLKGFARLGADYWDSFMDGFRRMGGQQAFPGLPAIFLLWPGPDGPESSVRFETLLEGMQEAEARSFLEQSVEQGRLSPEVSARVSQILAAHTRATVFVPGTWYYEPLDDCTQGWLERSRLLYRMAAEVAGLLAEKK